MRPSVGGYGEQGVTASVRQHALEYGCHQDDVAAAVAVGTSDDRDQHDQQECGVEGVLNWLHPLKTPQQWGIPVERGEPLNWALTLHWVSVQPQKVTVM